VIEIIVRTLQDKKTPGRLMTMVTAKRKGKKKLQLKLLLCWSTLSSLLNHNEALLCHLEDNQIAPLMFINE